MKHSEKKPYIAPQGVMILLDLPDIIDTSTGGFMGDMDVFVEKAPEETDVKQA